MNMELDALFNDEDTLTKLANLITADTFKTKRFKRYIEKATKALYDNLEFLKAESYEIKPEYFDGDKPFVVKNFNEAVIWLFQTFVLMDKEKLDFDSCEHPFSEVLFSSYFGHRSATIKKLELLQDFVLDPMSNFHSTNLSKIIDHNIFEAFKHFMTIKIETSAKDITEENYFCTLPSSRFEYYMLFEMIINLIFSDIEKFFFSMESEFVEKQVENELVQSLKNKIKILENNIKDLEEQRDDLEDELEHTQFLIKKHEQEKTAIQNANSQRINELVEENTAMQKRNAKLTEKYNSSIKKHISVAVASELNDTQVEFEELMDIDANGRYFFLGFDKNGFQEKVLQHFPNAIFEDTNVNLSSSIDMVIILTSHIIHSTYYAMKEQCKNKGIPMIHCKHSNINLIKELMWNAMNK